MPLAAFHPTIRRWFAERLGEPTAPQRAGWPLIRAGRNVLIAAPTGSGKTLAAFLSALDSLLRQGPALAEGTSVVYISPLKALSNDVAKNLDAPLAELRERDPALPDVRVLVRTGDTPAKDRQAMTRRPPHILVTTPESLYLLLTSEGGRRMLWPVRTVIVDEIHALARDKRGSHLALSLERLEALLAETGAPPLQRIGLSATQKPLSEIASFLGGVGRAVEVIDAGHLRQLDLAVEVPPSPLTAVCSHEVWDEIYDRIAELVEAHRTTLVFVNTRKLAERVSARLAERLGKERVRCHHGSLSKDIRLEAEQKLKSGELKALVATASLELGIDVGDVDLAIQVGSARSIATFLQRMGRAGHGVARLPKGRAFPLTLDELAEVAALLKAVRDGELDRIHLPVAPLDILAQQLVAECASASVGEDVLFERVRRAWPYRDLERADFDATVRLHLDGRRALLHRDGVNRQLHGTRRARLAALQSGGAIPELGEYRVILEPEGVRIGSVHEDFAVEASAGDVFQLGSASWRITRVEMGTVRVADAKGAPPSLPFWLGEAPGRTRELAQAVSDLRATFRGAEQLATDYGLAESAARQLADYLGAAERALGGLPTATSLVAERFFDETGGTQIVVHAPFGSRVNRALGLALRKRICRGFGFELQAAANEEAIVFSLGEKPGVPYEEIFHWLSPRNAEHLLVQASLATPYFEARWRWNATRSLLVERSRGGKPVPLLFQRMKAQDLMIAAFPEAQACPETLTSPDVAVPMEHPLVRQTIRDTLNEPMDVAGFLGVLEGIAAGTIATRTLDTGTPSPLAEGILAAGPYAFLDDAPLEERRTRAVLSGRGKTSDGDLAAGALDPDAVARVRAEAWPDPRDAEEVHEALCWMGYATAEEAEPWAAWLGELAAAGRVVEEAGRWRAMEADRDPKAVLRGRLEALGPVESDEPLLESLAAEGAVLRVDLGGRPAWCERRLLQRIRRYTVERLRKAIEPVAAADYLRFLARWQYAAPGHRVEGPAGVAQVAKRLAGCEVTAREWEKSVLPLRLLGYRREWLDQATLSGELAWGRLFGGGASAIKATPIALVPRADLESWLALAPAPDAAALSGDARAVLDELARAGALFPAELERRARLLPVQLDRALGELIGHGFVTGDSFAQLRGLLIAHARRSGPVQRLGRFSRFRSRATEPDLAACAEFAARALLERTGVVFRRVAQKEKLPVPWRDVVRELRRLELRGEVLGGRFVAGFDGEQYALREAVPLLRAARDDGAGAPLEVSAADPLNFRGVLTPEPRVPVTARATVLVG